MQCGVSLDPPIWAPSQLKVIPNSPFSHSNSIAAVTKPQTSVGFFYLSKNDKWGTHQSVLPAAGLHYKAVPKSGEFFSRCCISLQHQFVCSSLATWERPYSEALYMSINTCCNISVILGQPLFSFASQVSSPQCH